MSTTTLEQEIAIPEAAIKIAEASTKVSSAWGRGKKAEFVPVKKLAQIVKEQKAPSYGLNSGKEVTKYLGGLININLHQLLAEMADQSGMKLGDFVEEILIEYITANIGDSYYSNRAEMKIVFDHILAQREVIGKGWENEK